MNGRLNGKRVLVTECEKFMGPETVKLFQEEGANVFADSRDLTESGACESLIEEIGEIDVLIGNFASPSFTGLEVTELTEKQFHTPYDVMVIPLFKLTKAVLPQMKARRSGKIVVYGSATALKGMKTLSAYSAARAAQLGFVQSVGVEVAPFNVQVNLIAQNYVESNDYYPPELLEKESFLRSLKRQVPAGRLGTKREDALFALFLSSDESGFFVGQGIPFAGGWVQ